jgi:hypothetical protein
MAVQATYMVCDDVRVEWNGKAIVIGIYTSDLTIPSTPVAVTQLQFFLIFECGVSEQPKKIRFEVTLPNQPTAHWELRLPENIPVPEGRTKFTVRQPFAVMNAVLEPGQIKAKVTYEETEIDLGGPWIVQVEPTPPGILIPPSDLSKA